MQSTNSDIKNQKPQLPKVKKNATTRTKVLEAMVAQKTIMVMQGSWHRKRTGIIQQERKKEKNAERNNRKKSRSAARDQPKSISNQVRNNLQYSPRTQTNPPPPAP